MYSTKVLVRPLILATIIFVSCSRNIDPPQPDPVPFKPARSLSYIANSRDGVAPTYYDTAWFNFDSLSSQFRNCHNASIGLSCSTNNSLVSGLSTTFAGSAGVIFYDYFITRDANGRPIAGTKRTSGSYRAGPGIYIGNTTIDSLLFKTSGTRITEIRFKQWQMVSSTSAPVFKNDTTYGNTVFMTYQITYNADGEIAKVYCDEGVNKQWNIEYVYTPGLGPVLAPISDVLMLDYLRQDSIYRWFLSILQAKHALAKIKVTNLSTGSVEETNYSNYKYRQDGYPASVEVVTSSTGTAPTNPVKLSFGYN